MDQTRDLSGQKLFRLTRMYPPPEYVKKASSEELCGGDSLPPEAYGDPRKRLYPCHTSAASWASMAFLLDKKAELDPVDTEIIEERILRCARVHGVGDDVEKLVKAAAAGLKSDPLAELGDDDFALVLEDQRRYPLRNPGEVKAAAEYLKTHRDLIPFELRQQMAEKVLQKQAQLGVTLGSETNDYIERQAGYGACTAKEAADLILNRVRASVRGPGPLSPLQQEMRKLGEQVAARPSQFREPGMRVKIATVVDQFDREHRLTGQYGPEFPRVEDVLFGLTREKMAAAVREHCATTTGNLYALRDLERIKLAEVRDYFGEDFARQLTSDGLRVNSEKAASFISTLPRPDMEQLDRLMSGLGIKPMAKEASAQSIGISHSYLKQLAEGLRKASAAG